MSLISVVINVDTRPERDSNAEMFKGVVNRDFLVDGVINKRNLFKDFDAEFILFVDEHEPIEENTLLQLKKLCDTLVIRKHNKKFEDQDNFSAFNDFNYIQALSQARGKYVFHFDGDVAAFAKDKESVQEYIDLLEKYKFVSYPSLWSPYPVIDNTFDGMYWVSTRFFCCKRSSLDFTEIIKCQLDYDYWKDKYPRARLCHWLEHILQTGEEDCVYYPPVNFEKFILYTWENYHKYTLQRLNSQNFEEVMQWVNSKLYHYPNNLSI